MTEMARERVERLFGELHRELVDTREGVRGALRANAERWTPKGSRVNRPAKEEPAS
jgi:predicted transcriptional regulator